MYLFERVKHDDANSRAEGRRPALECEVATRGEENALPRIDVAWRR